MRHELLVLVVEDESRERAELVRQVQEVANQASVSITVHDFGSAIEARRWLRGHPHVVPELLVMDYDLRAGESGLAFAEAVADPFGICHVLLVTGRPESELQEVVTRANTGLGDRFLTIAKPAGGPTVRFALGRLLQRIEARQPPGYFGGLGSVFADGETGLERFHRLTTGIESLVRFVCLSTLSSMTREGTAPATAVRTAMRNRMMFGNWLGLLRELAANVDWSTASPVLAGFEVALGADGGALCRVAQGVKADRDRELAHGYTQPDDRYAGIVEKHRAATSALLREWRGLRLLNVVGVRSTALVDEQLSSYVLTDASSNTVRRIELRRSALRLAGTGTHLLRGARTALRVDPWFVVGRCGDCGDVRHWTTSAFLPAGVQLQDSANHERSEGLRVQLHSVDVEG